MGENSASHTYVRSLIKCQKCGFLKPCLNTFERIYEIVFDNVRRDWAETQWEKTAEGKRFLPNAERATANYSTLNPTHTAQQASECNRTWPLWRCRADTKIWICTSCLPFNLTALVCLVSGQRKVTISLTSPGAPWYFYPCHLIHFIIIIMLGDSFHGILRDLKCSGVPSARICVLLCYLTGRMSQPDVFTEEDILRNLKCHLKL